MPFMGDFPRVAIVSTQHALRAVQFSDERRQRIEIARRRTFADHQRHPGGQFFPAFRQRVAFMAVFDAGGDVSIQRLARNAGAVAV